MIRALRKERVVCISANVCLDVELSCASVGIHVTNLAVYRTFEPCSVVHAPYTPGYSNVAIRVASVECISIVEVDPKQLMKFYYKNYKI